MQRILFTILAGLLLTLKLISCAYKNTPNNLDRWTGDYSFEEQPVKANAGYSMVMTWTLSISKKTDSLQGVLEVNGQQTYMKLLTNISGDTSAIAITYDSVVDGSDENLKRGDTLFTISRIGDKLKTKWFALAPRLLENPAKECTCFVNAGTSSR